MSFRVETQGRPGRDVYWLHDDSSGASAAILPGYGFNLFDLRLPVAGQIRPIVSAAVDFAENPSHPARSGIPVLFPFPNRIRNARFRFNGRDFQLPANKGPHAIHGFAMEATWDVVEHQATSAEAFIVGRYQISRQSPDALSYWPGDAILEIRYGLAASCLSMKITIVNPTEHDLPYGFGIHPYFFLPFGPGTDARENARDPPRVEILGP